MVGIFNGEKYDRDSSGTGNGLIFMRKFKKERQSSERNINADIYYSTSGASGVHRLALEEPEKRSRREQ